MQIVTYDGYALACALSSFTHESNGDDAQQIDKELVPCPLMASH